MCVLLCAFGHIKCFFMCSKSFLKFMVYFMHVYFRFLCLIARYLVPKWPETALVVSLPVVFSDDVDHHGISTRLLNKLNKVAPLGQPALCWFTKILCSFVCFIVATFNNYLNQIPCNGSVAELVAWYHCVSLLKYYCIWIILFQIYSIHLCQLAELKQQLSCVVCRESVTQWDTSWGWKAQSKVSISMLHYWYACAYVVTHPSLLY